jgi:hypothetical protein
MRFDEVRDPSSNKLLTFYVTDSLIRKRAEWTDVLNGGFATSLSKKIAKEQINAIRDILSVKGLPDEVQVGYMERKHPWCVK